MKEAKLPETAKAATAASVSAPAGVRIVSSDHLATGKVPELSEMEFGMILSWHAFSRWMMRCMGAAGVKDMTPIDVLVLHHVMHRESEKKLADICFVLNVEDTHVVSYSLKKLVATGLVKNSKRGKEVFFSVTDEGAAACLRYRDVREACLMPGFSGDGDERARLSEMAKILRTLSGRYDQAARAASASGS